MAEGKERKKKAEAVQVLREKKEERQEEKLKEVEKFWKGAKVKREMRNLAIFLAILAGATLGRVALQGVPNVEPIIPLAIIAGLLLGPKEGFTVGGAAYIISNFFVWGLQGPWTIFQAIGAAIPGGAAGFLGKVKKPTGKDVIILSLLGTIFFQIVMNITGPLMAIGLFGLGIMAIPLYFLSSMPFALAHIGTNIIFAKLFSPLLKLRRHEDELKVVSYAKLAPDGSSRHIRVYNAKQ